MKIGYFGGTFDPIHNGHLHLIEMAREKAKLDSILVMPAGNPYHKQQHVSLMTYRYGMCRAALKNDSFVKLSDIEILRRGPSYTLITVEEIRKALRPEDELYLICGLDVVLQIHLWYEARQLLEIMKIAAFVRPGVDRAAADERAEVLRRDFHASVEIYDAPTIDVSSTMLREKLKGGIRDESLAIPPAVLKYIIKHRLYEKEDVLDVLKPETLARLQEFETILFARLSLSRLTHSLDTMYYAVELARRFGADPDKTAIAALTHDIAKELSAAELEKLWPDHPDEWKGNTGLLHGPAGAAILASEFGIGDPEILDAVSYHTTLKPDAPKITKIIFLADKLEPSRAFSDLAPIREWAMQDLDQAVIACLKGSHSYLEREKLAADSLSLAALEQLLAQDKYSVDK